jgi:predicted MFS family arabinose efflux permease
MRPGLTAGTDTAIGRSAVSTGGKERIRPALLAAPVISYADRFGFLPVVATTAAGLRAPVHTVSIAVGAYLLLYGLVQPLVGVLSDRRGRLIVLRCALAALACADLVAGLAPSAEVLIGARAAAGAASGALLPTTLVYLGDTVPFRFRQQAVSRVLAAAAFGAGAATVAAGMLARWASWRIPLLAFTVLAPVALLISRGLPEQARPAPTAGRRAEKSGGRHLPGGRRALIALLVFALFEGAAMLGFFTFFASVLEARGSSSAVAGLVTGAYGLATVAGSWLVARLPGRLVPLVPLTAGGTALVSGYLTAAITQSGPAMLVASALLGLAFALFHSTFQTWATQLHSAVRGTVTALFVSCVFTGAAVVSVLAGGLAARHAYTSLFGIAAGLSAIVVVAGSAARLRSSPVG